tara:strand:+ start:42 stop:326 length:285 start_codon:yes stop_codon:yes gene_type:complete
MNEIKVSARTVLIAMHTLGDNDDFEITKGKQYYIDGSVINDGHMSYLIDDDGGFQLHLSGDSIADNFLIDGEIVSYEIWQQGGIILNTDASFSK